MNHSKNANAIADAFQPATETTPQTYAYDAQCKPANAPQDITYIATYNPSTRRLRVMLYPHHETLGCFYIGRD